MIYFFYLVSFLFFIINDFFIYVIFNISIFQLICNNLIVFILDSIEQIEYNLLVNEIIINVDYNDFNNLILESIPLIKNELVEFNNIYLLCYFDYYLNNLDNIIFSPMQSKIYFLKDESVLSFYKIVNFSKNNYNCYAYYELFPTNLIPFFIKEQCFCMEDFVIHKNEILYLPIVFHISNINLNVFFILTYM